MFISKIIKPFPLFLLFFYSPFFLFSQDYNYTHYDVKDGLAGATVYSMVQDKDGFMWYGTETGLSRFDGTHFRNFYTSDGLPDNEILSLFVDSKNRVWMIPFKNSICYYWKGKIYNQENDSVLKRLKITDDLISITEDRAGNILLAQKHGLNLITVQNEVLAINEFEGQRLGIGAVGLNKDGDFRVYIFGQEKEFLIDFDAQKKVFLNDTRHFISFYSQRTFFLHGLFLLQHKFSLFDFIQLEGEPLFRIRFNSGLINISYINDSIITLNTSNGAYFFNFKKGVFTDSLLKHETINAVATDGEKNIWFSIPEKGVLRLSPGGFLNFSHNQVNKPIYSIQKFDSVIYAGSDDFDLFKITPQMGNISFKHLWDGFSRGRITAMANAGKHIQLVGTDASFLVLDNLVKVGAYQFGAIKSICLDSNNSVWVSLNDGVYHIQLTNFKKRDLVWRGRSTCSYEYGNELYVGTLNGLYAIKKTGEITYLGEGNRVFENRINSIGGSADGTLWVATNGGGLVAYKNSRIRFVITEKDGLTSNICRNIFLTGNTIWVGTDKGLNKISIFDSTFRLISYAVEDGLSSDIVNAVYADASGVYVGTPVGLNYFDENTISKRSICNLRVTGINISGTEFPVDSTDFILKHDANNIRFQFVGISFKSAGKISYRYRLLGLDTIWRNTKETSLSFQLLASGKYKLQLQATNKFGVQSNLREIKFEISKTIWEETWFRLLALTIFVHSLWAMIDYRVGQIRTREKEKSQTVKKIAELEQMAIKSQMNPHFIFNCLNSIQHYVIDKDVMGANEFISKFSRLIRLTLDYSSKSDISISEEIDYIRSYFELEQVRFEDKFTYQIEALNVDKSSLFIPPMILQPYIENAIRHGVRYREDSNGKIVVDIKQERTELICTISDNGIGRKLAQQYKSKNPIEYQSKGMELISKRIEMFNLSHESKIKVEITDLDENDMATPGTLVKIYFPLSEIQKYKDSL